MAPLAVLDTSAVLAIVNDEPGAENVRPLVARAMVLSVNIAEIVTKMVDWGLPAEARREILRTFAFRVEVFDEPLAVQAGELHERTRSAGLSLGDRACLALAIREGLPAITADRNWSELDVGVEIHRIR